MVALSDVLHRGHDVVDDAADLLKQSERTVKRHPYLSGGVVLLAIAVAGILWFSPELKKSLRLERA